jgi:hypothetical protein
MMFIPNDVEQINLLQKHYCYTLNTTQETLNAAQEINNTVEPLITDTLINEHLQ